MMPLQSRYVVEQLPVKSLMDAHMLDDPSVSEEIDDCINHAIRHIEKAVDQAPQAPQPCRSQLDNQVSQKLFDILTSRKYANCSKASSRTLRETTIQLMDRSVTENRPVPFYLDIGGGYGAAVDMSHVADGDGLDCLSFEPNCLHLFCLAQIAQFASDVRDVYPPGIRMTLVIDNLVAKYVNDIPIERTVAFRDSMSALIRRLGMQNLVWLLLESETSPFRREELLPVDRGSMGTLSNNEYVNILRFSGRWLSHGEAVYRKRLYEAATRLSEVYLARCIQGVHLTQRRSDGHLSFRSFPGGSARIQTGRASFVKNSKGKVIPKLLTTSNLDNSSVYYVPLDIADLWQPAQTA